MNMNLFNDEKITEFWICIMDKLSNQEGSIDAVYETLVDFRDFFDFEFSFIYHTDHQRILTLDKYFKMKSSEVIAPEQLDFESILGEDYYASFKSSKMIYARGGNEKSYIEQMLSQVFSTSAVLILPLTDEEGELIGAVGLGDRRRERRQGELNRQLAYSVLVLIANHVKLMINMKKVEQTESALNSIADNLGVDIYVNDFYTHEILYVNESMAVPYGGVINMMGRKCFEALYTDRKEQCDFCPQTKILDDDNKPTKAYSWDYERPFDSSWFRVLSAAFMWDDNRMAHIVSSIDITSHKRIEESISKIADYDHLTGLKSRRRLFADLDKRIEDNREFYLLFFDLNKFKPVNDKFGHRMGDELLKVIGSFLNKNKVIGDNTYRYGGDEFIILVDSDNKNQAAKAARSIEKRAKNPWMVNGENLTCTASIGIAKYPEDCLASDGLVDCADKAMYESKKREGGISFYNGGKINNKAWFSNLFS